jgi:hypothetical protein
MRWRFRDQDRRGRESACIALSRLLKFGIRGGTWRIEELLSEVVRRKLK